MNPLLLGPFTEADVAEVDRLLHQLWQESDAPFGRLRLRQLTPTIAEELIRDGYLDRFLLTTAVDVTDRTGAGDGLLLLGPFTEAALGRIGELLRRFDQDRPQGPWTLAVIEPIGTRSVEDGVAMVDRAVPPRVLH